MARVERGNHLNIEVHQIGLVNVSDAARELRRDAPELVVVVNAPVNEVLGELAALAVLEYTKPDLTGRRAEGLRTRSNRSHICRRKLQTSLNRF